MSVIVHTKGVDEAGQQVNCTHTHTHSSDMNDLAHDIIIIILHQGFPSLAKDCSQIESR